LSGKNSTKAFGDYQTPLDFANKVCKLLKEELNLNPKIVFEPTFGTGNFLLAALNNFKSVSKLCGVEINNLYYSESVSKLKELCLDKNIDLDLYNQDIFTFSYLNVFRSIKDNEELLILGNPPWVNNTNLSILQSDNIPMKSNFKNIRGIDSFTGKGNFDISEYILIQIFKNFEQKNVNIAFLLKDSVIKRLLNDSKKLNYKLNDVRIYKYNSLEVFNINCESSLFF